MKNRFKLVWLNFKVTWMRLFDWIATAFRFYSNWNFLRCDFSILSAYLFQNPFRISRVALLEMGEKDIYTYGETPLTTLDLIADQCEIAASDMVYELGCGRGRTVFWLGTWIGCHAVGIDRIPLFIEKAKRIKKRLALSHIEFFQGDILEFNLKKASVIYFYGTCSDDSFIKRLVDHFSSLKTGTRIITVSYPITDYSDDFVLLKSFPGKFTWGSATVYLQIKK